MRDITNYKDNISSYGGSELKMTYYIDNKKYMVKFPDPIRENNKNISYVNNQYSEYIGCHIFELFDIDVQKTELVICTYNNKDKIAVACLDFLKDDEYLIEFKNISYSLSKDKKYTTDINDIYEMIDLLPNLDNKEKVKEEFWDRFVIDALIGNPDRHLGNWGLISDKDKLRLAPVYDCGSSLNPLLSLEEIEELLKDKTELKNIAYNVKSVYKIDNKQINYSEIFKNPNEYLKKSILKIVPKIDMDKIKNIIYDIDVLPSIQKDFYYETILIRKKEILDTAYNRIIK